MEFEEYCKKMNLIAHPEQLKLISIVKEEMKDVQLYHSKITDPGWELQSQKPSHNVSVRV